ncbi:hypothetical protein [Ferruginibacter profundus]
MQKTSLHGLVTVLRVCIITFILAIISLVLFSFTIDKMNEDFLKQLGISKTEADKKITGSILGGYINAYGIKNTANIAIGNRSAIAKDLLAYTRQYVNTEAFKKEYAALKANYKPKENKVQTPEEMRKETIEMYKKSIAETEASLKRSDASLKPVFENVLTESRKQLKEAEDPNNKTIANYTKNYPQLVKSNQQSNERSLQEWEARYPTNHLLFVKQRLIKFLEETKDIDFGAELTLKNNRKVFVNPVYEKNKGYYWKMAFRAGKEVVEPARAFVTEWAKEIN